MRPIGALSLALLALLATPALAQAPPPAPPVSTGRPFGSDSTPPPGVQPSVPMVVMRLAYAPAEGCPAEQVFRDAVGAHVRGWDPFAPNAPWRLAISIARRGPGFIGSGELRDETGAVAWTRSFPSTPRCVDLVEDLAVALALRIDPPQGPQHSSSPPVPLPPPRSEQEPAPPPAPPSEPPPSGFRFGAMAWLDLAAAPRPAAAVTVDAGYRAGWFSISGEFRADPSAGATMMSGATLATSRLAGALVPCGHIGARIAFVGCVVGEVGQARGTVTAMGLQPPDQQDGLSAAAGVRLGLEVFLVRHLYFRGAADFMGALVRPRFRLDQTILWESPGFLGGFGAGLGALF